jgi:hypothetical protein
VSKDCASIVTLYKKNRDSMSYEWPNWEFCKFISNESYISGIGVLLKTCDILSYTYLPEQCSLECSNICFHRKKRFLNNLRIDF